jgi:hypothetical protein
MLIPVLWAIVCDYLYGDSTDELFALYNSLVTGGHIPLLESLELWKSWEDTGTFLPTSVSISISTINSLTIVNGLLPLQQRRVLGTDKIYTISLDIPNLKYLKSHVSLFIKLFHRLDMKVPEDMEIKEKTIRTLTNVEHLVIDFSRVFYRKTVKKFAGFTKWFTEFPMELDLPNIKVIEVHSYKLTDSMAEHLFHKYKTLKQIISHENLPPTTYTREQMGVDRVSRVSRVSRVDRVERINRVDRVVKQFT